MPREIRGKSVLITGASSGIGRAAALEFARRGARLGLAARREEQLGHLAEEIRSRGTQVFYALTDVAEKAQVDRFVEQALQEFGSLDVLINNAGFGIRSSVEQTTPEDYMELLRVNLLGTFHGIQAVLPHMKRQKSGHIINVSSVAGTRSMPQSGAYSSTKFAVNGLSEALRVEVAAHGIDVSVVLPISTATEFFEVAGRKSAKPAKPVGPLQTAEVVARAIVSCVQRPRLEVYPYPLARLLHVVNALWPGLIDSYARKHLVMR